MNKPLLLIVALLISLSELHAQDVEAIAKAKPIKVSGGLGTDHVFYDARGIDQRRNAPYQYYLNGNINFVLFGEVSLPLSFSYSNQKFNYSQPLNQQRFNQFGISPKYRWITAHAGWRSMTFSPYSLNGHTFAGGGVELTPGRWKISAMGGRFLKAVEYDSTNTANKPSYQRYGMGLQAQYEDKGNLYGASLFRAYDDVGSLKTPLDSIGVTPEENIVWSLQLRQKLATKLQFEGEFANSIVTKDARYKDEYKAKTYGLINENTTTVNYFAYNVKLSYQLKKARIGATYERIDPGYRTHGAYFFNNDLENITANYTRPFFKNKVNFGFNVGAQRNNLDKSKVSTMRRWLGSANLSWQVSKKLTIGANYSNFQTFTNMRSPFTVLNTTNPYQNIDTLNYMQITQSIGMNSNLNISANEKRQQSVMLNLNMQNANEEQGGKKLPTGTVLYNGNLAWMYTFVPIGLGLNLAVNGTWNESPQADSKTYGPTAGISKGFFKKIMQTAVSYSWNSTLNNNISTGYVGSLRLTNSITLKKKHSFSLSGVWLNRAVQNNPASGDKTFHEYTGRVGYNFRF